MVESDPIVIKTKAYTVLMGRAINKGHIQTLRWLIDREYKEIKKLLNSRRK